MSSSASAQACRSTDSALVRPRVSLLESHLLRVRVCDIDCACKLFKRDSLTRSASRRGAFFTAELLIKLRFEGRRLAEVGIPHYPRTAGSPTAQAFGRLPGGPRLLVPPLPVVVRARHAKGRTDPLNEHRSDQPARAGARNAAANDAMCRPTRAVTQLQRGGPPSAVLAAGEYRSECT